jgi:hypothetical protein
VQHHDVSDDLPPLSARGASPERRALLRLEVGRLRARESRRVFDASVHVGVLAGPRTGFVVRAQDLPAVDAALRTDVVSALLEDSPTEWATVWLVRSGAPEPYDADLAWWAAARRAFGMHDRTPDGCYVVTRSGWRDVVSGEVRSWARLRL